MSIKRKRFVFSLLRLSIAFGILYYLLSKIPLSKVIASVTSARVVYVITAFILSILSQLILAHRLRFLTDKQGMTLPTSQVLKINLAAIFYGLFLPGGNLTGGAIRFYKLAGTEKKMAGALASIVFDRMAATIALCFIGILFWSVDLPPNSGDIGVSMIIALGLLFILYILLFDKRISRIFQKRFKSVNLSIVSQKIHGLLISLNRYQNLSVGSLAFIFALSIIAQLFGTLIYYLLAVGLGINITFVAIGWIRSAVVILTMIPISISGLGVREGALFFLLKPYGILGEQTLAFSFLVFVTTLLFTGLIGGLLEGGKLLSSGDDKKKCYGS